MIIKCQIEKTNKKKNIVWILKTLNQSKTANQNQRPWEDLYRNRQGGKLLKGQKDQQRDKEVNINSKTPNAD